MSIRNGMPASELPEVAWRKSRRSGPQGGNCVEIAHLPDGQVAIRNSRHPRLVFLMPKLELALHYVHGPETRNFVRHCDSTIVGCSAVSAPTEPPCCRARTRDHLALTPRGCCQNIGAFPATQLLEV